MDRTVVANANSRSVEDKVGGLKESLENAGACVRTKATWSGETTGSVSLLPAELLMQIFSYIRPTSPAHVGSLMLACRYWNAVVLRTPVLWAALAESPWTLHDIPVRVYPERLAPFKFAVAHSGTLALDLTFVGMQEQLLSFLANHTSRICSLTLSVVLPKELVLLDSLLSFRMSNLGSLVIQQHSGPEYRTPTPTVQLPSLHEGCLPHLHTLSLSGRHFSIDTPLRPLRHLTLTSCSWTGCHCNDFTFNSLIYVLRNFPDLETLTVDSSVPAMGEATDRVQLRALRKLAIYDHSGYVGDLLRQLDVPRDTVLDLRIPGNDNSIYSQALPLDVRLTFLAVCAAESLHVRIRQSLPAMHVRTRIGGAIHLSMLSSSVNYQLEMILAHLQSMFAPVNTLTTLILDVWHDSLVVIYSLHSLLSMRPALLSTAGIAGSRPSVSVRAGTRSAGVRLKIPSSSGPDGRRALLPFMASAHGKRALRSLKHLYLTWNAEFDGDFHSASRSSGVQSDGGYPPPYGAQACEAFCARVAPVLAMDPYAHMLESLHVLIVKHEPPPNEVVPDIHSVQERLSTLLGDMVRVDVSWYVPEDDSESTLLGV